MTTLRTIGVELKTTSFIWNRCCPHLRPIWISNQSSTKNSRKRLNKLPRRRLANLAAAYLTMRRPCTLETRNTLLLHDTTNHLSALYKLSGSWSKSNSHLTRWFSSIMQLKAVSYSGSLTTLTSVSQMRSTQKKKQRISRLNAVASSTMTRFSACASDATWQRSSKHSA